MDILKGEVNTVLSTYSMSIGVRNKPPSQNTDSGIHSIVMIVFSTNEYCMTDQDFPASEIHEFIHSHLFLPNTIQPSMQFTLC